MGVVIVDRGVPPHAILLGHVDALTENLERLRDNIGVPVAVVLAELLLQMHRSLLGVVVGHLAKQVVSDVGVLDVVEGAVLRDRTKKVQNGVSSTISAFNSVPTNERNAAKRCTRKRSCSCALRRTR